MRSPTAVRLLLVPILAVLATACDDTPSPQEPLGLPEEVSAAVPSVQDLANLVDETNWADGYVWANSPTAAQYTPDPYYAFNRTGGAIQITQPSGTIGRYLVKFNTLSGFLGNKSTLHVTGYQGNDDTYCKPVRAHLVNSQVEVRCFKAGTGDATNASFSALVLGKRPTVAFAYAHQATKSDYAPQSKGSWNPGGAIRVFRDGTGEYRVVFAGLGALAANAGNGGHVQVSAVESGTNHCKMADWNPDYPNLGIYVQCYTRAGARADSKFNVLFLLPNAHLAYAFAHKPIDPSYPPLPEYSFSPVGGAITITRFGTGRYTVDWSGIDAEIIDGGNVQVTAMGLSNTQCKVEGWNGTSAEVRCFAPSGAPVDGSYMVLLGS